MVFSAKEMQQTAKKKKPDKRASFFNGWLP
jgi:hypothetical protein